MHGKRLALRMLLLLLLGLTVAACGGAAEEATATEAEPTEAPTEIVTEEAAAPTDTPVEVAEATPEAEAEAATEEVPTEEPAPTTAPVVTEDARILAWVAPAAAPGSQGANAAGELVYFNDDGSTETVLALPNGVTTVSACGPAATAPDGSGFVLMDTVFSGGVETATLRLFAGDSRPQTIAENLNPIACFGSAPLEWSPDAARFGYIDWPENASSMNSPYGRLRLLDATGQEIAAYDNVTDFDLTDDGAGFVRLFVDNDGFATEVSFATWDGNVDQEVASFVADEDNNCYYNSASIQQVTDGFMAVMGYRCQRGDNQNTQWRLYLIDPVNNAAQLEQTETAGGRYFVFSDTNAVFASPDASSVFFTVPDGVTNQTASVIATSLDPIAPETVINRFAVMSSASDLPYDANNATARVSRDGRWLAIVTNDGNNDATLNVLDLNNPTLPPIVVDAGDAGDTVSDMVFNHAGDRLYFVAGANEGGNNSLFALDLTTGAESRMRRGRYGQFAISPDDSTLAIMNWVEVDPEEPRYLTLETIDIESTTPTVIFEGGTVTDGTVTDQRFAYPLTWR